MLVYNSGCCKGISTGFYDNLISFPRAFTEHLNVRSKSQLGSSFTTIHLNKGSPQLITVIFLSSSAPCHKMTLGQEIGGMSGFGIQINQSIPCLMTYKIMGK
ncbi:hypothetical protein ACB098_01G087300 [Castanea mollissima]